MVVIELEILSNVVFKTKVDCARATKLPKDNSLFSTNLTDVRLIIKNTRPSRIIIKIFDNKVFLFN